MEIYIRYQDDGSNGLNVTVKIPHDQLHIFDNKEKAVEFIRKVEKYITRINPRITAIWYGDQNLLYPSVEIH